jgi:hypothetical protein
MRDTPNEHLDTCDNCSHCCAQATPESAIFERAMLDRVPLDELVPPGSGRRALSTASGRLVLLGDAAHAMHSGPGQVGRASVDWLAW